MHMRGWKGWGFGTRWRHGAARMMVLKLPLTALAIKTMLQVYILLVLNLHFLELMRAPGMYIKAPICKT